jgi:hypothetical protein
MKFKQSLISLLIQNTNTVLQNIIGLGKENGNPKMETVTSFITSLRQFICFLSNQFPQSGSCTYS